jgi:hypothetical protein
MSPKRDILDYLTDIYDHARYAVGRAGWIKQAVSCEGDGLCGMACAQSVCFAGVPD